MNFQSLSALEVYLTKMIKDSMEDVGKKCEVVVREKIEEEVYQNPVNPSTYERTRELKNSLIHTSPVQNGSEIITEIKHETDLIGSYSPNQHMSVQTGEPFIEPLAEVVNYGKAGHIFGEGYWTEPRPYMDDAREEIKQDKLHVQSLKESLRNKGIQVEG